MMGHRVSVFLMLFNSKHLSKGDNTKLHSHGPLFLWFIRSISASNLASLVVFLAAILVSVDWALPGDQ